MSPLETEPNKNTTNLGLFAKHWQPGHVKTRLAAGVGFERAAAIYRQFVRALLARLTPLAAPPLAEDRMLAFTPRQHAADFRAILPDCWRQEPQADGDLGQRMNTYFAARFAEGYQRVVLLGTDSPNLPLEFVAKALAELKPDQVVLGPTEDGGYYLVGAHGPTVPPIFTHIAWSTSNVWQQTLQALRSAGTMFHTLPSWYDVDDMADYQRLLSDLAGCEEPQLQQLLRELEAIYLP